MPKVRTNDRVYMPGPWHSSGPAFPLEEGKTVNMSLGFETLPLCVRCHELYEVQVPVMGIECLQEVISWVFWGSDVCLSRRSEIQTFIGNQTDITAWPMSQPVTQSPGGTVLSAVHLSVKTGEQMTRNPYQALGEGPPAGLMKQVSHHLLGPNDSLNGFF